jgi:hypothetical protein
MIRRVSSVIVSIAVMFVTMFGSVLPAFAAVSAPTNLVLVGGVYTNDTTPTFTWNRPANATWYEFILDDGSWKGIGNGGTYTLGPLSNGWHTFFLRAHDNSGNISVSTALTFEIDTEGPVVPMLAGQESGKTGATAWYSTYPNGEAPAAFCDLYENGKNVGGMTRSTYSAYDQGKTTEIAKFTKGVTFTSAGSYSLYARCADTDGNYSSSATKMVTITGSSVAPTPTTPVASVAKGAMVKTACDSYAPKSDSCHSVYYYGADGKRHGFTSEAVYRSWNGSSYSGVVIISMSQMNAMPVGENVTMRPGTSLVKFMGSSTVYAVEKGGALRPIVNEAVAKAIYGSRWTAYIVELPGSVKKDYSYGEKIDSSSDYSKSRAYYSVTSIDSNF